MAPARLCARYAYQAGAKDMLYDWRDDAVTFWGKRA